MLLNFWKGEAKKKTVPGEMETWTNVEVRHLDPAKATYLHRGSSS
jgi:hypothetical protein